MAIASPLVALNFSSILWIIPPLMVFGLSSPVTLTPILPEMGETVNEMVTFRKKKDKQLHKNMQHTKLSIQFL